MQTEISGDFPFGKRRVKVLDVQITYVDVLLPLARSHPLCC